MVLIHLQIDGFQSVSQQSGGGGILRSLIVTSDGTCKLGGRDGGVDDDLLQR